MRAHIAVVAVLFLGVSCYNIELRPDRAVGDIACRVCDDVQWPELCSQNQTCEHNQICFTEEYIDSHNRRSYRLGCHPNDFCHQHTQSHIVGRRRQSDLCYQCCNTTDCNWKLCHPFGWPSTFAAVNPTPPAMGYLGCNFDWDTCGWKQVGTDHFDWSRQSGPTLTAATGPQSDHNSKSGYYLYIESSTPRIEGDLAQLQSPSRNFNKVQCLTFWYNMYGSDIGSLTLSIKTFNVTKTLWRKFGDQRKGWFPAHVPLPATKFTLTFTGVVGKGYQGDIAIDDIKSTYGQCVNTGDLGCNFDSDTCGWQQVVTDQFDWIRQSGPTTTFDTGPQSDHTSKRGYYMYIESSAPRNEGDLAQLRSPSHYFNKEQCLAFWYNMYGRDIGSLTLSIKTSNGTMVLWSKSGDQGTGWFSAQVSLPTSQFTLTFTGVIGNGFQGDIAIDDIKSSGGQCV